MAVTSIKKSKVSMYKMVSLPTISGSKDAGVKATQSSYRAFTTGLNKIGGTLNSTIVVNNQIRDALIQNLKLQDATFEEDKKRFQKEKEDKNKTQKKTGGGFLGGVAEVAANMTGGFLAGLAGLAGTLMKFVITQSVLKWIANPANMKKLVSIVEAIIKVVTFFSKFLSENIVRMLDGLATMLDGNKNIFQKLGGFITFITGFGSILGAALILKKPGLVLKGVGWVLKTLYTSLFKSKIKLTKQVAAGGGGGGGGFGGFSKDQSAKAAARKGGGGRFGAIAKGIGAAALIATPLIVGASMGGDSEESSTPAAAPAAPTASRGGGTPPAASSGTTSSAPAPAAPSGTTSSAPAPAQKSSGIPQLALGGVATRPTEALIGEAGPELRMPLDNAKRMRDSGIKPLSSLMGGNNPVDSKQSKKLSDLFIAPFRGIGAGILANVSQLVSGMGPAGAALTPILGNIIAPIANSFGVPPSLVKSLTSKTPQKDLKPTNTGKNKGDLKKLFGRGSVVKEDSKKYKRVGDSSVLGLLTNMLAAVQVIGNKAGSSGGGGGDTTAPGSPSPSGDPASGGKADMHVGDSVARGISGQQGNGTKKDDAMVGRSSKDTLGILKSKGEDKLKDKTIRLSSGILNSPDDIASVEEQLKYLKSVGAKVQLIGVPTNNKKYSHLNVTLKKLADTHGATFLGGYEAGSDQLHPKDYTTLRAKYDTPTADKKLSSDQGALNKNTGMKVGEEKTFRASDGNDYKAHKTATGFKFFRTGLAGIADAAAGGLDSTKIPIDTKDGKNRFIINDWQKQSTPKPDSKAPPAAAPTPKASGGWINGPQSGYPVSLDGGGSTSFIGHGTEWVGFKKAAQGGAFVVPFDTPATKNNPGLTSSRMTQAKSGGYTLPGFKSGGKVKPSPTTTGEKVTDSGTGENKGSGGQSAVVSAGKYLLTKGFTVKEHPNFSGRAFDAAGKSRVGGHSGGSLHYKNLALDITDWRDGDWQGRTKVLAEELYKNRSALKLTQIIHDPWGSWFAGGGKGGGIGGHDTHLHLGFASGPGDASLDLKGGDGGSDGGGGGGDTTPTEEAEANPFEALSKAVSALRGTLGYAPSTSVEQATLDTAKAKDQNAKSAKEKAAKATGDALRNMKSKSTPSPTPPTSPSAVILPGGRASVPVELAWASTTSLYQPKTQIYT